MSRTTNVGVSVRIVPGPGSAVRLPASAPATASAASIGRKRPASIASLPATFANVTVNAPTLWPSGCRNPVYPANAEPLLFACEV